MISGIRTYSRYFFAQSAFPSDFLHLQTLPPIVDIDLNYDADTDSKSSSYC